jgi:hypothetical protein
MPTTVANSQIQILDSSLNLIANIIAPYPLNKGGDILQYSKELDTYGQARFRISAFDSLLTQFGDIFVPHVNHVRIQRNGTTVWQGAIIENTKRTKEYWEIIAVEYLWYLSKILVNRTSNNPASGAADNVYRIFNSGTMAAAVTAIMNETITTFQSHGVHTLSNLTLGTVTNPNYPPNITSADSPPKALTGEWYFGNGVSAPQLQFDFHKILYILKSFGVYTYSDFWIDNSLVFNFTPFRGNNHHYDVSFNFGQNGLAQGNIIDYNIPRLGQRMYNDLIGIATDVNGVVLHYEQSDQQSIDKYGLIQGVAAYSDVKDQATLNARIQAELPLISQPDNAAISVTLNEKGVPFGVYDIGDIVSINIANKGLSFTDVRRIVGITVLLHNTGREYTIVQTNKPLPWQMGTS